MMSVVNENIDVALRELISDYLGVDPDQLSPDVSLIDDLAVDSLELCEVSAAIEDRLGLSLSQRALNDVRTYGDLMRALGVEPRPTDHGSVPLVRSRLVPAKPGRGQLVRGA